MGTAGRRNSCSEPTQFKLMVFGELVDGAISRSVSREVLNQNSAFNLCCIKSNKAIDFSRG